MKMLTIPNVRNLFIEKESNKLFIETDDSNNNNDFSLLIGCKMSFDDENNLTIIATNEHYGADESEFIIKGKNSSEGRTLEFDAFGSDWLAQFVGDDDLRDGFTMKNNRLYVGLHRPFSLRCTPDSTDGPGMIELRKT